MYAQTVKPLLHKISATFISFIMVASLLTPLSVHAEGSPSAGITNPSTTYTTPSDTSAKVGAVPSTTTEQNPQTPSEQAQSTAPAIAAPASSAQTTTKPPNTTALNAPIIPQTTTQVSSNSPTTQNEAQTSASLSNIIGSAAESGDAGAAQNTTVGNVTTGDANALATIVNLLQSSVNLNGSQPIVFVQDVKGNVTGDLVIDPATLASSLGTTPIFGNNGSTTNTSTQASIDNAIDVNATSGNANVTQNTTVGNVQSGSANAVVNLVNLINSAINANQSFVGVINIYGNLDGNILVPADFVNSVLSTGTTASNYPSSIITTDGNASVTNNVNTAAQSGNATATDNTTTGNVKTGTANSNITILNLTSNQTVGKNALLVFVNVLGTWVGLILDAPAGSTAASIGGGATSQTSTNSGVINSMANQQITNTINAGAQSGNATAHENTTVGNIGSGNASSSVNLLNILNSQISLSDWFGILFINVFGTWTGNFGAQTAVKPPSSSGGSGADSTTNSGSSPGQVFNFVPSPTHGKHHYIAYPLFTHSTTSSASTPKAYSGFVLSSSTSSSPVTSRNGSDRISLQSGNKDKIENQSFQWWIPVLGLLIISGLIGGRYYVIHRSQDSEEL